MPSNPPGSSQISHLMPRICPSGQVKIHPYPPGCQPFGATALLSLHLLTWLLWAGHRVPLTMCDPWMTCFSFYFRGDAQIDITLEKVLSQYNEIFLFENKGDMCSDARPVFIVLYLYAYFQGGNVYHQIAHQVLPLLFCWIIWNGLYWASLGLTV